MTPTPPSGGKRRVEVDGVGGVDSMVEGLELLGFIHGVRVRDAFLRRSAPSFQLQSPVPSSGVGVLVPPADAVEAAAAACTEDIDEADAW